MDAHGGRRRHHRRHEEQREQRDHVVRRVERGRGGGDCGAFRRWTVREGGKESIQRGFLPFIQ